MRRALAVLALAAAALCGPIARSQEASPEASPMRRVEEAIARLPDEPSLAALERAALKRADADPDSVRWLAAAIHVAAALPAIKLTVDRDVSRDESLDRYQDDPDRWGADTGRGVALGASAEWKLGELVFDPDEVRVYDLLGDRADRREALLTLLVGTYFERRRLMLTELLVPAATPDEAIGRRTRIDELTAVIDALTGGLLSRNLKRSSAVADDRQ
jgi:hypothetical protein